jgi:predicted GNAT family acetyltransferase
MGTDYSGAVGPHLCSQGACVKDISLSEFKLLKMGDILDSQCLRVTGDGDIVFYAVVKPQGPMVARIEGVCSQIDAGRGK